jgi:septal ring-binding cell division protein DamX
MVAGRWFVCSWLMNRAPLCGRQMRRDAELAAALWSQEMSQQQQQQPSPASRGEGTSSDVSSPPTSPSKRGPPWPAGERSTQFHEAWLYA